MIGRLASINLILLGSGQQAMLEQAVKRLKQDGIKPQGIIFNQVLLLTALYDRY